MKLKAYFLETRPQFLLLSLVLAFLGTAIAWSDGSFHAGDAVLVLVGITLAHISVNVLNDYCDFRSGVDLAVRRTPFNGGSGILPAGMLKQNEVFWMGTIALLLATPIGIYFILTRGWLLLPLLLVAALSVVLYTPYILKTRWPEWAAGLGLGTLPILGAYFAQTGTYSVHAVVVSVVSGILVHNLLLLNEFPDVEADKLANRKTLPIIMGTRKAFRVYSGLMIALYAWIVGAVIIGLMPAFELLALLTLPLAYKAIRGARWPEDPARFIPAQANNVFVVLLVQLLMGVGYILEIVI